jgi:hypothetical protein
MTWGHFYLFTILLQPQGTAQTIRGALNRNPRGHKPNVTAFINEQQEVAGRNSG